MRKKVLSALLSAVMCVGLLTGCGNASATEDPKDTGATIAAKGDSIETDNGDVSLTVWAEEANFEVLNEMIESFKQEYSGQANFDIQLVESADSATRDNVLGDVHNAADVFPFADDQLASLVSGGTLSKVPNADEIKSANVEGSVEAASVNGVLYGYPFSADNGYFLYYDKKYFSDSDVQSLDQVLKVCADNGKKMSMQWSSGWYLYAFFGNTGLEFGINEDGVTNYCNWNSTEGNIKGVDIVEALKEIAVHPGFMNLPDEEFPAQIANGTVIAGVSGIWNETAVKENWGADYGAVKLPTYTVAGQQVQMASFTGYKIMGVNPYSEHVAWAHKLADWFTNEENQVLRFEKRSQGPSNIKAADSDAVGQVPAIQAVIEQSQYGVLQRVGNNFWTPSSEFGELMATGTTGGLTSQEAIDNLVAGITASTVN